jgi:hypothetical protein
MFARNDMQQLHAAVDVVDFAHSTTRQNKLKSDAANIKEY